MQNNWHLIIIYEFKFLNYFLNKYYLLLFSFLIFSVSPEDHCHRERNEEIDKKARRKLLIASVLCVVFMIAEIVGNIKQNSWWLYQNI